MKGLLALLITLLMVNSRFIKNWLGGELIDFRLLSRKQVKTKQTVQTIEDERLADGCKLNKLSNNETTVITMLWKHNDRIEIADFLGCDVGTVNTHISNIYIKLNLAEKSENLIFRALLK